MAKNKFFSSLIVVMASNLTTLVSGLLMGLLIPQLMGVENYGHYKIFILYATYASLLHFGFVDGILLKYGGTEERDLDIYEIRANTKFIIYLELLVSLLLLLISLFFMTGAYKTIFIFLSFYSFFLNITSYFQYMTQAVLKFKILSTMNVLQASLNVVVVLSMFLLGNMGYINELNYRLYLVFYIAVYACVAMMYMIYFKNLTAGPSYSLRRQKVALFKTLKSGINVTLSYQIAVLILNLDNQFISLLFNARTFGIYSFAYSLISITTTVLTAVSTVIFPHLNRKKVPEIIASYDNNMRSLMMVIYIAVMVYYPVFVFVHIFLTQYIESLQFFRILLPGVGITSCISLIIFNYYKILKKGMIYLVIGIGVLLFSIIVNVITYLIFKTAIAIAVASLFEVFIWYLTTNYVLSRLYQIKWKKNTFYLILMILVFESITGMNSLWVSMVVYVLAYILITLSFFKSNLIKMIRLFKN